jgi:carotenoid 1,2-hydratase
MHARHDGHAETLRPAAGGALAASAHDPSGLGGPVPGHGRRPLWQSVARLGGLFPAAGAPDPSARSLLHGRGDPPGSWGAHGSLVRAAGSAGHREGPRFNEDIPAGGYSWWYVDAISDDGQHGLTIIAFLGSVFSPYYKRSGRCDPLDHASLNIALYGPQHRWVMTERGRGAVERDASNLVIGPSAVRWDGEALTIDIVEGDTRLFVPWQRPVRGRVRVFPEALNRTAFALDGAENHIWHCLAPRARIDVEMSSPGISWNGKAYLDHNRGAEPLETGFNIWHWSRAHLNEGALVCYEGERGDGSLFASALRFGADGVPEPVDLPPIAQLPPSKWRVDRRTRSDIGVAEVRRTWEDTPFYARSELASRFAGEEVVAVQESLDMRRFSSPLVQFMLPYRMPRRAK